MNARSSGTRSSGGGASGRLKTLRPSEVTASPPLRLGLEAQHDGALVRQAAMAAQLAAQQVDQHQAGQLVLARQLGHGHAVRLDPGGAGGRGLRVRHAARRRRAYGVAQGWNAKNEAKRHGRIPLVVVGDGSQA